MHVFYQVRLKNGTVKLEIKQGVVTAHVNSPEVGKVNEEIDTEKVTGDDLTISFNPTYLIDSLKALNSEKVTISLSQLFVHLLLCQQILTKTSCSSLHQFVQIK